MSELSDETMGGSGDSNENNKNERIPELGLALSGGGFRAAFFHLGMMGQLARWELLQGRSHQEVQDAVISTKAGG